MHHALSPCRRAAIALVYSTFTDNSHTLSVCSFLFFLISLDCFGFFPFFSVKRETTIPCRILCYRHRYLQCSLSLFQAPTYERAHILTICLPRTALRANRSCMSPHLSHTNLYYLFIALLLLLLWLQQNNNKKSKNEKEGKKVCKHFRMMHF